MPAADGEVPVGLEEGVCLLLVVEHRVEREEGIELRPVKARHCGARANAARVPRHEVEARIQILEKRREIAEEPKARSAWPTWVR